MEIPLLWDNILIPGELSNYFLHNGISWNSVFHIPVDIDCGHPPFLSMYYTYFYSLPHLAQFPFLAIGFYALLRIASIVLKSRFEIALVLVLLIADTTVMAQATQAAYEWPMIALVLLALLEIIKRTTSAPIEKSAKLKANWQFIRFCLYVVIIPLMQLRGIPAVLGLALADYYFTTKQAQAKFFTVKAILPYLLSGLCCIAWYVLHYTQTGFWLIAPNSTWANEPGGFVNLQQLVKNLAISCWRLCDFGHLIYWLLIASLLLIGFRRKQITPEIRKWMALFFLLVLPSLLLFIVLNKPICHRYYLLVYCLAPIALVLLLQNVPLQRWIKNSLLFSAIAILISGSFWVYPDKIATGWDSTLAYLPYFILRNEAFDYIKASEATNQVIKSNEVAAHFPLCKPEVMTDQLVFYKSSFEITDIDTAKNYKYILYSNICTAFTDEELDSLKQKTIIKEWHSGQVKVILYKR